MVSAKHGQRSSSTGRKNAWIPKAVAAVIGAACLGALIWSKFDRDIEKPAASPTAAGDYYDWQLSQEALAERIRPLVAESVQRRLGPQAFAFQLATKIEDKDGKAEICLREAAYWSDGVALEAMHVIDAARRLKAADPAKLSEDGQRWAAAVAVEPISKSCFSVTGHAGRADLDSLLSSRYLTPVRQDLIDGSGPDAWLTTLGAYRLSRLETEITPGGSLLLIPNPRYYRGVVTEDKKIAYDDLQGAESQGAQN